MIIWILTRTFAHGVWHVPASLLTTPIRKERTGDYIQRQLIETSEPFINDRFHAREPLFANNSFKNSLSFMD